MSNTQNLRRWTRKEDATLKKMVKENYSDQEIAEHLGRTKSAVTAHRNSIGVKSKTIWTKKEDVILKRMTRQGASLSEISDVLGRTPAAIAFRRSQMGISRPRRRFSGRAIQKEIEFGKNRVAKPVQVKKSIVIPEDLQPFEIEESVDVRSITRSNPIERERVRLTLQKLPVRGAFVVEKHLVHTVKTLANSEFPEFRIRTSPTSPEKKHYRIIRLA